MNGVLLIAHAPLAHALRQCALHVFPDAAEHVAALDVHPNAPPEETLAAARIVLDQLPVKQRFPAAVWGLYHLQLGSAAA